MTASSITSALLCLIQASSGVHHQEHQPQRQVSCCVVSCPTAGSVWLKLAHKEDGADFVAYNIYVGSTPTFTPSKDSWVARREASGETIFRSITGLRRAGTTYYYKITALDRSGKLVYLGPQGLGSPTAEGPLAITVTRPYRTLNIVYIGDSITEGGWIHKPDLNACEACSRYLERLAGPRQVSFANEGHSGHTTTDYLPGGDDFTRAEASARKLSNQNLSELIFSIMLGTNDSASVGTNGAAATPEKYLQNMSTIVDKLLTDFPECKIVLQPPTWYSPNTHNSSSYEEVGLRRLTTYMAPLSQIAREHRKTNQVTVASPDAYSFFADHYQDELNQELGQNGIFYLHPNARGCEDLGLFWAESILKCINTDRY